MKILDFFHCSLPHSWVPSVSNRDCRITGKGGVSNSSWWDKELTFSSRDRNTVLIKLSKYLKKREEKRAECGHQTGKPVSKDTGTRTVCWKQNFSGFHLLRDSPPLKGLFNGCGHFNTERKIKAEAWALVANVHQFPWNWEHWVCISPPRLPPCVSSRPPDEVNASRGMAPVLRGGRGILFPPAIPAGVPILGAAAAAAAAGVRRLTHLHGGGVGGQLSDVGGEKSQPG